MTTDARINTALPSHPKTKKLIRRIGKGGAYHLICLFLWAASNRPNGDLSGMSDEDIELAVDWDGETGEFVKALEFVGFLDGDHGLRSIHDWAEHNPWAAGAPERSKKAKFAALCKKYGKEKAEQMMPECAPSIENSANRVLPAHAEHTHSMLPAHAEDANRVPLAGFSTAPSPSPSPIPLPNTSVPKGTGDESPEELTDDEKIFVYGLPLLTNAGTAERQARSFLGGLKKANGAEKVVEALRQCYREKPLQPLEWLAACLPMKGKKTENFASKDYGTSGSL